MRNGVLVIIIGLISLFFCASGQVNTEHFDQKNIWASTESPHKTWWYLEFEGLHLLDEVTLDQLHWKFHILHFSLINLKTLPHESSFHRQYYRFLQIYTFLQPPNKIPWHLVHQLTFLQNLNFHGIIFFGVPPQSIQLALQKKLYHGNLDSVRTL